ncbi:MAG: NADH-quinone oxidoreductase subunit C [Deltaproteobacteria bacterium]|nr:NADH-quinone oxidoreductase subunit C [Deltaproteobacteria bacterium]MBW1987307.1 NADH-quinone oxidoreductase subunit C [Deltaproteobacteria bacterium]MBW2135422.1 NADH-quinone oxidoreductase subunit C [Deltaproteobacteria bacterium]
MLAEQISNSLKRLDLERVAPGDYRQSGYHVEAVAQPDQILSVAQTMLEHQCFLESLTALDLVESFEVVYHFACFTELCRTVVHVPLSKGKTVPTLSSLYPGADWFEREVFDLFGIIFAGHPNLKRLILPEDADFHPLLKDFVASS